MHIAYTKIKVTGFFSGSILQKKWKNIRDRFAREIKENKGKSGQGHKAKNVYMFANQLAFLRDVIRLRPTDASKETMDPSSPNHENDSASETQSGLDKPVHVSKKRKGNVVEKYLWRHLKTTIFVKKKNPKV